MADTPIKEGSKDSCTEILVSSADIKLWQTEHERSHERIEHKVDEVSTFLSTILAEVSDLVSDKKARVALRSAVLIVLAATFGSAVTSVWWTVDRINEVETVAEARSDEIYKHVNRVEQEERANAKYGFELARGLRRDVDKNEQSINKLQSFHHNSGHVRPAKE